jgi:uncharacterized protein YfeS
MKVSISPQFMIRTKWAHSTVSEDGLYKKLEILSLQREQVQQQILIAQSNGQDTQQLEATKKDIACFYDKCWKRLNLRE